MDMMNIEKKEALAEHCHSAKSRSKMRENRSIKSSNSMQGKISVTVRECCGTRTLQKSGKYLEKRWGSPRQAAHCWPDLEKSLWSLSQPVCVIQTGLEHSTTARPAEVTSGGH